MTQYQSFPGAPGSSNTLEKLRALRLPSLNEKSYLDVGCNEGFFCGFAKFMGANRAVGIDFSADAIERARKRFPDCEFHKQSWDNIPGDNFDVILLASAIHYAEDQPALVKHLVNHLSPDGTLIIELGMTDSKKAEWKMIDRGIDKRYFASLAMWKEVLSEYAWKFWGKSVRQAGDPLERFVIHVSKRKPIACVLMKPPGFGKTNIANQMFEQTSLKIIRGDSITIEISKGMRKVSKELQKVISHDFSHLTIASTLNAVFKSGLGDELVDTWIDAANNSSFVMEGYVPPSGQRQVIERLKQRGFLPAELTWDRPGPELLAQRVLEGRLDKFLRTMPGVGKSSIRPGDAHKLEACGFVDEVAIENGTATVAGWAIADSGELPDSLLISINGQTMEVRDFNRISRPGVKLQLGLASDVVGYQIKVNYQSFGVQDLDSPRKIKVMLPSGMPLRFVASIRG